jgi:hypothetical protein
MTANVLGLCDGRQSRNLIINRELSGGYCQTAVSRWPFSQTKIKMNTLVSVRTNIVYAKKKKQDEKAEDEFVRHQELIFLVDKPTYRYSNEGEIIRERGLNEVRFTVSDKAFEKLIELLEKLKDVDESELS